MKQETLIEFLKKVDSLFPVPLSQKTDITEFSEKLIKNADIIAYEENDNLIGLAAGYIRNSIDDKAYISLVAVLPEFQGRGIGKSLVEDFIDRAKIYHKKTVHLYAVQSNIPAIKMYHHLGFDEWKIDNETRPSDLHLIKHLESEGQ